jgi:dihydrofolate reductase
MISLIVAYDKNRGIGKDNQLVWKQSADLKRFKDITSGKTVVMGRKTFESIGRPLPNRNNIVLTKTRSQIPGVIVISDIEQITEKEYFVIGGSEIYKLFIDYVDEIYATLIDCEIDADSWFPQIDMDNWNIQNQEFYKKDEKNHHDYAFIKFVRKKI